MTQYNPKINDKGEYTPFYGWSVILNIDTDLKFIENYIKNNNMINKYYSALPSESYHMTLYNIWCNGSELLNHQKRVIDTNFTPDMIELLGKQSKNINFFNPKGCINDLLYKIYFECQENKIDPVKLIIKNIYVGENIAIVFDYPSQSFDKMNILRQNIIKICERDDKMGVYHITLAYKYKDIPPDHIKLIMKEINTLIMLLSKQTLIINKPFVSYFSDMTSFLPFKHSLHL